MAIDKKAIKKAQRKKVYERIRKNQSGSGSASYTSQYTAYNSEYSHSELYKHDLKHHKHNNKRYSNISSSKTANINSGINSGFTRTATRNAVRAVENRNEDDNAGVNSLTYTVDAGIKLSGHIHHYAASESITEKDIAKSINHNISDKIETGSISRSITQNLNSKSNFLNPQLAVNRISGTQTSNSPFNSKSQLYNRNRKRLYKQLQNKSQNVITNIKYNLKKAPKRAISWAKRKALDFFKSAIKPVLGIIIAIVITVVMPAMTILIFTGSSGTGCIEELMADVKYAYPADENDITRATIHWQSLIMSLNTRFNDVPNMVTEPYDNTKSEKCDIEEDTQKILSFLSAYYSEWTFNDDVRNFLTQIFNEMYVITYDFESEPQTLTSITEINKSELPSPLPDNYIILSEYQNENGNDIAIVSISEIKDYITLNYAIMETANFEDIINKYLNDTQKENYVMYYERKGGAIKAFSSPFAFDWTNCITSPFGYRYWGDGSTEFHKGLDFGVANGTELLAVADGTVKARTGCTHNYPKNGSCGCNGGFGNYVEILTEDGTRILYGHMSQVMVADGQEIQNGQVIGTVGCTGWSTGFHLHLQMVKDGEYIDPLTFIKPYEG